MIKLTLVLMSALAIPWTASADRAEFTALCKDSYKACMYLCPGVEGATCKTVRGNCRAPVVRNGQFYERRMLVMDFETGSDMTCKVIHREKSKFECGDFGWGYECRRRK